MAATRHRFGQASLLAEDAKTTVLSVTKQGTTKVRVTFSDTIADVFDSAGLSVNGSGSLEIVTVQPDFIIYEYGDTVESGWSWAVQVPPMDITFVGGLPLEGRVGTIP